MNRQVKTFITVLLLVLMLGVMGVAAVTAQAAGETAPRELAAADVKLGADTLVYNGVRQKPAVTVSVKSAGTTVTLKKNTDYTLTYRNNLRAGQASVTVTGKGAYTGTVTKTFTITPKPLTSSGVTLDKVTFTYDGSLKKPVPTVTAKLKDRTGTLTKNVSYRVAYQNNKKAGTGKVIVTGMGSYTGTVTKTFTIRPKKLNASHVKLSAVTFTYDGSVKKPVPTVTVKFPERTANLTKNVSYRVSYSNNKDVGRGKVIITGMGSYTGTVTKTFRILPKGTTVSALREGGGKLTAYWNRQKVQTDGYQLMLSRSKTFSGGHRTVTVAKPAAVSKVVKNLEAGTTWYVRIRTYRMADGERFCSAWSAAKSVKLPHTPPADGEKYVALTFDDGPDMRYTSSTGRILDTLERYGARATFFVLASQLDSSIVGSSFAERNTGLVKRAADLGMEIGSHTYNHKNLNKLSAAEIRRELDRSLEKIEAASGKTVRLVRPPYGNANQTVRDTIDKPMINWDVDTLDWDSKNPDKIYSRVMNTVRPGSVILMHDIYGTTADAVERVVPALIEKGYKIVTVSELYDIYGMELQPHKVYYAPWYD